MYEEANESICAYVARVCVRLLQPFPLGMAASTLGRLHGSFSHGVHGHRLL